MLENQMKVEKDPTLLADLKTRKDLHLLKSEEFYKELKLKIAEAENDDTVETLSFDFQQNMPLPAISSGDVFYKRQLWVFNFTIGSAKLGRSYCYLYDETIGSKGQSEVISMVNHLIENEVSREVTTLYIFSDNCSAQNKNYALLHYFYTLVKGLKKFEKIVHRYPEPGHSYLPCDRTFGNIEKVRRKKENLFVPKDCHHIIKCSSTKFVVIDTKQDMFLD